MVSKIKIFSSSPSWALISVTLKDPTENNWWDMLIPKRFWKCLQFLWAIFERGLLNFQGDGEFPVKSINAFPHFKLVLGNKVIKNHSKSKVSYDFLHRNKKDVPTSQDLHCYIVIFKQIEIKIIGLQFKVAL